MKIKRLSLYQFKNYYQKDFSFDADIICISGKNGSGKTSILDAIYFLCFTKSYFVNSDSLCVTNQQKGMMLKGIFEKDIPYEVQCILRENGKKEFLKDKIPYTQLSKHIGQFSAVFISPDDTKLITDGSEERRKYIDILISQIDSNYIQNLISYNKILQQRNALLKNGLSIDYSLLDYYDERLSHLALPIYELRKYYGELIQKKTNAIYQWLSQNPNEMIEIEYTTQLHENNLLELLKRNREKDIFSQRSNYGIHKDNLSFTLYQLPFKNVASQGQRKSFLFGLKFAQYEILKEKTNLVPLLLLDDVFEKLDEERSRQVIHYISQQGGQVFLTDTHKSRLNQALQEVSKSSIILEI